MFVFFKKISLPLAALPGAKLLKSLTNGYGQGVRWVHPKPICPDF
jgi:hypothetical protein